VGLKKERVQVSACYSAVCAAGLPTACTQRVRYGVAWRAHRTAASVRVLSFCSGSRARHSSSAGPSPPEIDDAALGATRVEAAARRAGVPGRKRRPVASARQSSLAFSAIVGCVARWLHVPTVSSGRGMATAFLTAAAATGEPGRSHPDAAFRWCTLSRPTHACHFHAVFPCCAVRSLAR
jgi:hypothetical protein